MKHSRMVGDTLLPLNAIIQRNGQPLDLASYTVKFQMEQTDGTEVIAETDTGITKQPTQSFTREGSWLLCDEHGLKGGEQVLVVTSNTLPAPLATGVRYYPVNVHGNRFQLGRWPGDGAITLTDAGLGTHTFAIVGGVQFQFAGDITGPPLVPGPVAAAGRFRGWFTVYDGDDKATAPVARQGITIEVVEFGEAEPVA